MSRHLGIDVSEGAVRAALVRTTFYGPAVVEALTEVSILEAGGEAAALKLATSGMRPDSVGIAVPGDQVLFRRVELPVAAMRELANVLPFELEASVPMDMAEVVFDSRTLPRAKASTTAVVQVALSRSVDVREHAVRVQQATSWVPDLVTPGPLAFVPLLSLFERQARRPPSAAAAPAGAAPPGDTGAKPVEPAPLPVSLGPDVAPVAPLPVGLALGSAELAPGGYALGPLVPPDDRPTPLHPTDPLSAHPGQPEASDPLAEDRPTPSRPIPVDVLQRELDARSAQPRPEVVPRAWEGASPGHAGGGPSLADVLPYSPEASTNSPGDAPGGAAPYPVGAPLAAVGAPGGAPQSPGAAAPAPSAPEGLPAGPILYIDISERRTDVVVAVGAEPAFIRTLSRGTSGLPASAAPLAREIRQSLAANRLAGGEPPVAFVLLGPGSAVAGASVFLEEELGIPAWPFPAVRLKPATPVVAEALASRLPRHAKAVGLALSLGAKGAYNLRGGALQAEQGYPFVREKFPVLFGLVTVVVMSFGFSYLARSKSLDADKEVALAHLGQVSLDVFGESTTDVERAREMLEKGPTAEDDPLPRADAFDVMVQLAKAVPKDIVHDVLDLDVARGHVTLQGAVPSVTDAQKILDGLKEHRCLRESKGVRTSQFGPERLKYTIELDLKCEDKKKGAAAAASASAGGGKVAPPPTPTRESAGGREPALAPPAASGSSGKAGGAPPPSIEERPKRGGR